MNKKMTIKKRLLILFLLFLVSGIVNYFRYASELKNGHAHPVSYWAWQVLLVAGVFFAGFFLGFPNLLMANLYKKAKNK